MSNNFQNVLTDLADAFRANSLGRRELEHRLLEIIADELDRQTMDRGTWLKAFTEAGGDTEKAKARYIDLRLRRLKDELAKVELVLKRQSRRAADQAQPATTKTFVQSASEKFSSNGSSASDDRGGFKSWLEQWLPLMLIFAGVAITLGIWIISRPQHAEDSTAWGHEELSYSGYAEGSEFFPRDDGSPVIEPTEPMFQIDGPSFDCEAAKLPAEIFICSSPELAARDFRMARTFEALELIRSAAEVAELQRKQRIWLDRRNACSTEECVARSYDEWLASGLANPQAGNEVAVARPILEGRWANYRSAITKGWNSQPTLDGRWVIIRMGCGTGCTINLAGDHETGQIHDLGIGGEGMPMLELKFDDSSNRIFAQWEDFESDTCQRGSYIWTGTQLEATAPINITPRPAWGSCPPQG